MSDETSPRAVRFSQGEDERPLRPVPIASDSDNSNSSNELAIEPHLVAETPDELGSLGRYAEAASHSGSMASLGTNGSGGNRHRGSNGDSAATVAAAAAAAGAATSTTPTTGTTYANGSATPRPPQRPTGPARTPSNTYQPARKPTQQTPSFIHTSTSDLRSASKQRGGYGQQEKEYVRRLRAQDYSGGTADYFVPYSGFPVGGADGYPDTDSEGETPSSEAPFDDTYDQNVIIIDGNDDTQPTEEELRNPTNRERLEWHGMLEAVLTGDVVRQEKKRLIGATVQELGKSARGAELWMGIRARLCGRHLTVQRRMVEDARGTLDRLIGEVIDFKIAGESEAGKSTVQQVRDVIRKIEHIESHYPSRSALLAAHKSASTVLFQEACDAVVSWHNVSHLIQTELTVLKQWVGNDELDFSRARDKSPSTLHGGLADDSSFMDRLMKEEGLRSLHDHVEEDGKSQRRGMLRGIMTTVEKARETLLLNYEVFKKRHLPLDLDELLTLISFPSRLIEEIIKVRLAYTKRMKESAQQNPMMQDQMISQFRIVLKLATRTKIDSTAVSQPQPGWELPPCIDESFDQVVLDALRYYFKMLNWKLSGNKNTFKEAELLFQEWDFANEIASHLYRGDIEVAEQFSSLTFKTLNRLSITFEKELQRKPKESVSDMSKRYKQVLESVRVRQRMLQRFSRMLNDNYENASDFSISFRPDKMQDFFARLQATGHFQVYTGSLEHEGLLVIASPTLADREHEIQSLIGTTAYEELVDDPTNPYLLVMRPEGEPAWWGHKIQLSVREEPVELKTGHLRLIAGGSQLRLANAKRAFLDIVDTHLDLLIEQRSNLPKVNARLMEIRKVQYKLSNTFMDSVEIIRKNTKGLDYQELIQTCFVFATEFGQRSLLYLDSNRRQMNNLKLAKLALDWVSFICEDCQSSDRRAFRWAVLALEFAMVMNRGRHILALGESEYDRLRCNVGGCMRLLISHFDIMGARSTMAAQAEKLRLEAMVGQMRRLDHNTLNDDEASSFVRNHRLQALDAIDEGRKELLLERSALGRVLEASNEVDRSLALLSSTATNFTMRWQQGHFVGGGTFGNVYSAVNLDTGHLMAVKEIRLQDPKLIPTIATQIKDEMRVLESVDHPNVVSYYGIEVHRDRVYIFMEYCHGGSLANLLEHGRIEDEQVIMVYALQLLEGLAYLHEIKVAHRDIKPENILLDHHGIIKYVDFGAAKVIARQGRTLAGQNLASTNPNKSMTGTPMYMSPEVIKGETPGHFGAIDVWSLGCVVLEMATGRRPWGNLDNEWAIMYNIAQGNPPQLPTPDQLSPKGIEFLERCFVRDSKKRATALELLHHDWIMTIRNSVVQPPTPSDGTSSSAQATPNPAPASRSGSVTGDGSVS
ncbi:STE/STE11 protein kinase [Magnaporthiopsis poae ATCC 64411]|uniref:MAP kinase kinase kinase n=1 Tax=Magnaporthiopsis poae (strain ATCC 64411 / 73-15) TaxID=644358 RepID=A0A0C4DT66_MAGP6|nr:STE/STE11 protein kinase [Magnaporthiopsis poae ATCC 64411]